MNAWKQFRFVTTLLAVAAILLFSISACKHTPCIVPNPLIQFGLAQDTFGVTPNQVPLAKTVQIAAFDATGTPKGNFTVAPDQQQKMHFDTSVNRPIQLKFTYQDAKGSTIAEDSVRIYDIVKKGVTLPDMDIVVGFMNPGGQTCPTPQNTLTPTITNAPQNSKMATFPWIIGDSFEITLLAGSGPTATSKKFRLNPDPTSTTAHPVGIVNIYNSSHFTCLTLANGEAESEGRYSMVITAISDFCTIQGLNNTETQVKTISVTYPSNYSIIVKK